MPHVVIIGAGSIGLYLAYKLKKDGIKNIIIYDQRAGEYVRPGHINGSIFRLLENKLGKSFWQKEDGHIKEFERILYDQVRELAIPIEKKRFIRLHQHDQHKGIIVADAAGQEELVECEYLFDCTGSRRLVAHNVNDLVAPKPFTIEPIAPNVRIKNHFLAYQRKT